MACHYGYTTGNWELTLRTQPGLSVTFKLIQTIKDLGLIGQRNVFVILSFSDLCVTVSWSDLHNHWDWDWAEDIFQFLPARANSKL